ncbi:MAG: hypothetical protein AB1646_03610 [Thermodesulfobacteriota bacterium]
MPDPVEIHEFTFDPRLIDHAGLERKRIEAFRLIHALRWKESRDPDHPLIVSLMGGTGTGKSTVFNSLAGRPVSRTGSRRPCTHKAMILLPNHPSHLEEDWSLLFSCLGLKTDEVADFAYQDHLQSPGRILVDTPDFDSVELANRHVADLFFVLSDVLVLVTSQEKYADMVGMDMRRKALSWGKSMLLVMNKVTSQEALEDFREERTGDGRVVGIDRIGSSPELIPGLRDRAEFRSVLGLAPVGPDSQRTRQEEIGRLRTQCASAVSDLDNALASQIARIERVRERIGRIVSEVTEEMELRLKSPVSGDLEARMRGRLQVLLDKYDLLFGFRERVRNLLASILDGILGTSRSVSDHGLASDREWDLRQQDLKAVWSETALQPLELAVARLNFDIMDLVARDPTCADLLPVVRTEVARWSPDEVRQRFDETLPRVMNLLDAEFDRFRQGLSPGEQLRLYGSQTVLLTVWPLLVVTVDLALTGGHLTIVNALLGAAPGLPFAPFITKWFVSVRVVELLREIGRKIEATHRDTLRSILREQAASYEGAFERLLPPPQVRNDVRDLRERLSGLPA